MTKKDFELISLTIADFVSNSERTIGDSVNLKTVLYLTGWLECQLQLTNKGFDKEKFEQPILKACKDYNRS